MRRGARVGGVSSISGAIESRRAFSVGAGSDRPRLPERREEGGGRPLSRATAPEPKGSVFDSSPDFRVNMCVLMTYF